LLRQLRRANQRDASKMSLIPTGAMPRLLPSRIARRRSTGIPIGVVRPLDSCRDHQSLPPSASQPMAKPELWFSCTSGYLVRRCVRNTRAGAGRPRQCRSRRRRTPSWSSSDVYGARRGRRLRSHRCRPLRGCSVVGVAWSAGKRLTHAPGFRTSASRRRRCFLATSSQSVTEVAVALGPRSHQPVLSAPASRSLGYADHSLVRPYSRTRERLVPRRTSTSSCSAVWPKHYR
jgi:hypothetical protein